jgi:hypothetical protein
MCHGGEGHNFEGRGICRVVHCSIVYGYKKVKQLNVNNRDLERQISCLLFYDEITLQSL